MGWGLVFVSAVNRKIREDEIFSKIENVLWNVAGDGDSHEEKEKDAEDFEKKVEDEIEKVMRQAEKDLKEEDGKKS